MHSRLTKHHAERLVNAIDTANCYGEVLRALRWLLEIDVKGSDALSDEVVVHRAAQLAGWPPEIVVQILAKEADALAETAAELCELRSLQRNLG